MNAQSSCAANFIYENLLGLGRRRLHVDLAGPATDKERDGLRRGAGSGAVRGRAALANHGPGGSVAI